LVGEKVVLTDEATHAIRHNGPTDEQLIRALNSNYNRDIPSSRHIRWMAAELLKSRGFELQPKEKKETSRG